jgi:hypothetical protein
MEGAKDLARSSIMLYFSAIELNILFSSSLKTALSSSALSLFSLSIDKDIKSTYVLKIVFVDPLDLSIVLEHAL